MPASKRLRNAPRGRWDGRLVKLTAGITKDHIERGRVLGSGLRHGVQAAHHD
jgi:hypothetical protein